MLFSPDISLCLWSHLPLTSSLFPYTTLFRSRLAPARLGARRPDRQPVHRQAAGQVAAPRALERSRRERDQAARRPRCERLRRSEEHTSELQSPCNLVCRLLLEKKNSQLL